MRVDAKEFFRAVEYVAKARASGNSIPLLSGVRIDAEPGRLRVSATDLEVLVETEIPAVGDGGWATVVDPTALKGIKGLAEEFVWLGPREERDCVDLVVSMGDEEAQLSGVKRESLEDWPNLRAEYDRLYGLAEMGPRETTLLPHLLAHASDSDQRPVMCGVYLDAYGLTATDASRLLHVPTPGVALDGIDGAILSAGGLRMLMASPYKADRVTVRIEGNEPEAEKPGPKIARLEAGPVRIWARLIEGRYPNYREVVRHRPEPQFVIEPDQFDRIRRVLTASDRLARRGPAVLRVAFEENQVGLETSVADSGTLRARYPVRRWNGTAQAEAHYQARFLRDMLNTFEALEEPIYAAVGSPALFEGESGVVCRIMPWRVQ